jgi:hypothetical protein
VQHVIIDHCSLSWGEDETASIWAWKKGVKDVTFQWNFITESLHDAQHPEGPHGMGFLAGGGNTTVSLHHNLLAHHDDRNPLVNSEGTTDFRNNLVYNFADFAPAHFSNTAKANMVNNHYLLGPNSAPSAVLLWIQTGAKVYLEGNWTPRCPTGCANEWDVGAYQGNEAQQRSLTPFPAPAVTTHPTAQVKALVLANAGASRPVRDPVDTRIVHEVETGTGQIIDHPNQVGGYPGYQSGTPPPDTDHDGIPDAWETAHGLNPAQSADGAVVTADGYTNLEHYLNELAGDSVFLPGDLNDDGQVTLADLRLLMQMLIGQGAPSGQAKALAAPADRLTLADARALVHLLVTP